MLLLPQGRAVPLHPAPDAPLLKRFPRIWKGDRGIMGSAYGNIRPAMDFPRILELYRAGKLKLQELVSRRFGLAEINEAFRALGSGEVARGLVVFD